MLQCGWDEKTKQECIGANYKDEGAAANDIYRTNVPNSRLQFRYLMLREEKTFISSHGQDVLSRSSFFSRKNIGPLHVDDFGGDVQDVMIDSKSNELPSIKMPMPKKISVSTSIQMRIDGLLQMMDSINDDDSMPMIDDMPHTNEKEKESKRFVQTHLGNGLILDEKENYLIIQMQNMIASIAKTKCKFIQKNEKRNDILLRIVSENDLHRIYNLEVNGYPSDEAASREKLFYRFIFAKEHFMAFALNGNVIGFVCGTKTKESKLTDETMSIHDRDGKHLCIHSVVIDDKYKRRGYGTKMMKEYVKHQLGASCNASLLSLRLVCKKHLFSFYANCGFKLIGESDLEHGKDTWYEMASTSSENDCAGNCP